MDSENLQKTIIIPKMVNYIKGSSAPLITRLLFLTCLPRQFNSRPHFDRRDPNDTHDGLAGTIYRSTSDLNNAREGVNNLTTPQRLNIWDSQPVITEETFQIRGKMSPRASSQYDCSVLNYTVAVILEYICKYGQRMASYCARL